MTTETPTARSWYTNPRLHRTVLVIFVVILLVEGIVSIFHRDNDFLWHRKLGAAFLQGEPYGYAGFQTYPLGRAMMNSLLAVGHYQLTRALSFLLAIVALIGCFEMWRAIADRQKPIPHEISITAGLLAAGILLPYLQRDFDECGLQVFLLFFLSAAAYCLARGRQWGCGFWLATATMYKASPLLFLPFLLWKRQWKAAGWMVLFLVGWAFLPAAYLGWNNTLEAHGIWFQRVSYLLSHQKAYPSLPGLEVPNVRNLALSGTLARYLETYPENHSLYLKHPWFMQFGDLSPQVAWFITRATMLILGIALAWRFRRRWHSDFRDGSFATEWAVVCILCTLLAPQCWKQHLIVVLPVLFLVLREMLTAKPCPRWRIALLVLAGLVIYGGRRFIVGGPASLVLISYKLDTFAVLLIMLLALVPMRTVQEKVGERGMPVKAAA